MAKKSKGSAPAAAKSKAEKSAAEASQTEGGGFNAAQFLKETREELAKVVWPSRKQLVSESAAVILMVTLVATVIYLADNLFIWISGKVF